MRRDAIMAKLVEQRAELRRMGVRSLALFGSVARDEARADSDVDLLVEFDPPATFDKYMDVKLFLEDSLGHSVDLVTQAALKARMRPIVEHEALHVA